MRRAVLASILALVPAVALAQQPLKVGSITATAPRTVAEFETRDVKGEPTRLLWSEDGTELYLQTSEKERGRVNVLTSHHVFSVDSGKMKKVDNEPAWAKAAWAAKSDRSAPDKPSFMIDVGSEKRVARGVSVPMGGDMARGGIDGGSSGTSSEDALSAAQGSQGVTVLSLKLGGKVIGEFINAGVVPGMTFGWGPKGTKAIAYSNPENGRIVIMDVEGKTQELDATGATLLPVFSADGEQLAWLRRNGRNKYQLQVTKLD
jgi:hypothetical protein